MDKSCRGSGATHNACSCFLERLARYEKALELIATTMKDDCFPNRIKIDIAKKALE